MGELNGVACNDIYTFKPFRYTEITTKNSKPTEVDNEYYYKIHAVNNSTNIYIYAYAIFWGSPDSERQILKFNFATRKWTNYKHTVELPHYSFDRCPVDNVSVLENDVLMIFGSRDNNDTYELYIYRLDNQRPSLLSGELLLYDRVVVCHNGYVYAIGGRSGYDIHRIHLETLVWEIMYEGNGQYKERRSSPEIACAEENIFMLGGIEDGGWIGFREISIFNIVKKKWTKRNTTGDYGITDNDGYPSDRGSFGVFQSHRDTKLKLFFIYSLNEVVEIWKLDLEMFQWARINILPSPPGVIATAISPDASKHYTIRYFNNATSPEMYITWLRIPKLSQMCWEAVLHYPKVFDVKELIRAGVPLHYVNSIK